MRYDVYSALVQTFSFINFYLNGNLFCVCYFFHFQIVFLLFWLYSKLKIIFVQAWALSGIVAKRVNSNLTNFGMSYFCCFSYVVHFVLWWRSELTDQYWANSGFLSAVLVSLNFRGVLSWTLTLDLMFVCVIEDVLVVVLIPR